MAATTDRRARGATDEADSISSPCPTISGARVRNHADFVYAGIRQSSNDDFDDGKRLAQNILRKLRALHDSDWFSPKLFVLLVSPQYGEAARAELLLTGIYQALVLNSVDKVPLIGSSVAAVYFDNKVSEHGAVLICIACRFTQVHVQVAPGITASDGARELVSGIVDRLDPGISKGEDPNPNANRTLLAFFPTATAKCSPDQLHRFLSEKMLYRVPIVGGVSSANDKNREKQGIQFAGRSIHRDALVVARLESPTAMASSLGRGLERTNRVLHVKKVTEDRRYVLSFEEERPFEGLSDSSPIMLLGETTTNYDLVRAVMSGAPSEPVRMLREVPEHTELELLRPNPTAIRESTVKAVQQAQRRLRGERPIGAMSFSCTSYFQYRIALGLDDIQTSAAISSILDGSPVVGGFVDGEAGVDETGRSVFVNWGRSNLVFGDEHRDRSVMQLGFNALAQNSRLVSTPQSLDMLLPILLEMVRESGFPGAMVSLLYGQDSNARLVPTCAVGPRFLALGNAPRAPLADNQLLELIRTSKKPLFFSQPLGQANRHRDRDSHGSLISQYVVPLHDQAGALFGALQIDLGDVRYKTGLHKAERLVLDALGTTIAAALAKMIALEEISIVRKLDDNLNAALMAVTTCEGVQQLIEAAVKVFGADGGYVRVADPREFRLVIGAGTGRYYEAAKGIRSALDSSGQSRTSEAFLSGETCMVNDASNDEVHQRLLNEYDRQESDAELWAAIKQTQSYGIAVFRTVGKEKAGTVTVLSDRPWFFQNHHRRCLEALSERLSLLIEHLQKKEAAERTSSQLKFLIEGIPQLRQVTELKSPSAILTEAVTQLRVAMNADVASLYLWEEEIESFVLRAQNGWVDPRWVGAARYAKHESWTGTVALQERARHFPDLQEHKAVTGHRVSPVYSKEMFGRPVTRDLRLQAISLPLRVGPRVLGVLTLHRLTLPNVLQESFVNTDADILQCAAEGVSALVAGVADLQSSRWTKEAHSRRQETYHGFAKTLELPLQAGPEDALCRLLCEQFGASQALFWFAEDGEESQLQCLGSHDQPLLRAHDVVCTAPDERILASFRTNRSEVHRRPRIRNDQRTEHRPEAATDGTVSRACVVIRASGRAYGVIDLHWQTPSAFYDSELNKHLIEELYVLGNMIGSKYHRHLLGRREQLASSEQQRSDLAVQAMGAMVFQFAHRFNNLLQDLLGLKHEIETCGFDAHAQERLTRVLAEGPELVQRPLDIVTGKPEAPREHADVRTMVMRALDDAVGHRRTDIGIKVDVSEHIVAWVDTAQVTQAFANIIGNALKAIERKEQPGVLAISAVPHLNGEQIQVMFTDTGTGMTREQIKAAELGFVSTERGGTGVGVLLARVFVQAQGGTLTINSAIGQGTEVIVRLPVSEKGAAQ
ncbi:MAG TPA: GAF domain-containing protein [Vicinamibacterales bacterium]|nr:GAF domain-containing protein [Vicinamibacterales bacterium]